jgi:hypothetical protein
MDQDAAYLERTLLTVLLWAGLWGLIDLAIHKFDVGTRAGILLFLAISSFLLLKKRGHINNL